MGASGKRGASEADELEETTALVSRLERRSDSPMADDHLRDYSWLVNETLGSGRYQKTACVACGLGVAAGSTEVMAISLVLLKIENELTAGSWERNFIASCIFLGMLFGGLISGVLGDIYGRKTNMVFFTAGIAVFGACTSLASTVIQLAAFRFLAGLCIGGNIPSIFSYVAEITNSSGRGQYMTFVASHWMVGSVAAAAIGWLILPTDVGFLAMRGWRLYFLVCVVPAILCCALVSIFLVESPCFLIRKNQFSKAARSLEVIAETNGKNMSLLRELTQQLHASQGIEDDKKGKGERTAQEQKPSSWKDDILQLLLEKEYRKTTMVLGIIWFCLSACWYGFMIWLPQFLQAKHDHVYLGNLITSAADLPGDFISFLLIEKIGRKKTLLISLVSAALLPLFFAAAPKGSPVWAILGSACFGFVSVGGWNALSILSPELFDTSVRATMHGFLTALGRVGGFIGTYFVGHFAHAGIWLPCIFATGILLLGCVATLFVPETSGKVITDYQVLKSPTTSSKASDP